jgi:hypothetical protein
LGAIQVGDVKPARERVVLDEIRTIFSRMSLGDADAERMRRERNDGSQ